MLQAAKFSARAILRESKIYHPAKPLLQVTEYKRIKCYSSLARVLLSVKARQ